jgi:hypothetical protein
VPTTAKSEGDMLQGTLDMLVLQTLVLGPAHGHTIAQAIEHGSSEILQVEHGSLYPALYRWKTGAGLPFSGAHLKTIEKQNTIA